MSKKILGWHFTRTDTLANNDERKIVLGETLTNVGVLIEGAEPLEW